MIFKSNICLSTTGSAINGMIVGLRHSHIYILNLFTRFVCVNAKAGFEKLPKHYTSPILDIK